MDDVNKTYKGSTGLRNSNKMEIEKPPQKVKNITILDLLNKNQINTIRTIPFTHFFTNKVYNLHHVSVHQQFVPNVCGYHASFNILEVLEALKAQDFNKELRIVSSGEFWKFKNDLTNFIWQYKLKYEPNNDKWPWKENDVIHGDFERTYLNICLRTNNRFKQALSSDKDFKILYFTWEYQFGRIVQGEAQQKELQAMMNEFIKFNQKDKHIVFAMMLGITNHWGAFIAHKCNETVEFFFLDSRNRDYLEWNEEQIQQWVKEAQEKRKNMFLKPWTEFDIQVQTTCVHDIQESLDTLCQCLIGNMTLHDYQCNNLFLVFEKQFKVHISYDDVLSNKNMQAQLSQCNIYAKDYYYTIQSFFKTSNVLKFLTTINQQKFTQMKKVFITLQQQNRILNPKTYHQSYIEPLSVLLLRANL